MNEISNKIINVQSVMITTLGVKTLHLRNNRSHSYGMSGKNTTCFSTERGNPNGLRRQKKHSIRNVSLGREEFNWSKQFSQSLQSVRIASLGRKYRNRVRLQSVRIASIHKPLKIN
jgi:hypothetical protein